MIIDGHWFAAGSAARVAAKLSIEAERFNLLADNGEQLSGNVTELKIGQRLGNVSRKITLPDNSVFATANNDAVDALLNQSGGDSGWLHSLESHLGFVLVAVVATVLFGIAFFKWGVPMISTQIAHALPEKTNQIIAGHTLGFLDDYFFEPSQLSEDQQQTIRKDFHAMVGQLDGQAAQLEYQLHFRDWSTDEFAIPNALALPNGDLILTDKFVELSENSHQINSVLLHEVGHVVHRHSLTMVIEATLVTVVVMLATGDNNGIADMGLGLGSLLVSSNYSRAHESEADLYAFRNMLILGMDPKAFSQIMQSMDQFISELDENESEPKPESESESTARDSKSLFDYLSSHPNTQERIERAQRYSACFANKVALCKDL